MSGDELALREGLPSGTELGEYEIEAAIGQGGFGVVYRAKHRYLGTVVALKEYLPATVAVRIEGRVCPRNQALAADYEEGLRRFIEEARHLVQFRSHLGVVTCVGFFEERGTAYMAMEYEEGLPLSELLTKREAAGRPLDEGELLRLAGQVLESLTVVHQSAVLHRDIKPSNILIRRSDDRPVLIDFGAAKEDFVRYTKSSAPHTRGYAAIEQMEADGKLGPWTDLYGLGAVLWRIVAGGHPPYEPLVPVDALSRMAARFRGQDDPLPSAHRLGEGRFSIAVLDAIDQCLELEPTDRPANCGELLPLLAVPVRKDLVESLHANSAKHESGREERGSQEEVEPVPEFTVRQGESQRWSLLERAVFGSAVLITVFALSFVVLLGGRRESSETVAPEDRQRETLALVPGEELMPRPSTEETDSTVTSRDSFARGSQRLGSLTVNTEPTRAHVRLLDGAGEYRAGMELRVGEYRIEVSAEGYETHVTKVRHGAGPTELRVELERPPLKLVRNSVGMELVWVPAGEFVMGSESSEAYDDEVPLTEVTLSEGFYLGKYEVRQREWEAVMGTNPSEFQNCGPDCPVESVLWDETQEFISRLNAKEKTAKYRLPTEAEWEYAARAQTTGERYGKLDDIAWHGANSGGTTHPVGEKEPNAYGLHDMLGNVREWVSDWYGEYPGGRVTDPLGPSNGRWWRVMGITTGPSRVRRGGSWVGHATTTCRAAFRYSSSKGLDPNGVRFDNIGFRLAKTK